jgi:hypothetical protein
MCGNVSVRMRNSSFDPQSSETIVDIVPELKLIIGEAPPGPELSRQDARRRDPSARRRTALLSRSPHSFGAGSMRIHQSGEDPINRRKHQMEARDFSISSHTEKNVLSLMVPVRRELSALCAMESCSHTASICFPP